MNGIDSNTCDEVSLKLSGLIGMFDLLVDSATNYHDNNRMMSDFAYYISNELQTLFKLVSGVAYHS